MIDLGSLVPTYGGPNGNTIQDVAEFLRLRIQEGAFLLGDQIAAERDLAIALGVGRTTISGAYSRLQAEGYVERRRGGGGGTYVTDLLQPAETWCRKMAADMQAFREKYEYRLAVETYAAGLAAKRRSARDLAAMRGALAILEMLEPPDNDPPDRAPDWQSEIRRADFEFHAAICNACQSRVLARAVLDARATIFTSFLLGHWDETPETQILSSAADHRTILAAIDAGRVQKARLSMERHLLAAQTRMEQTLRRYQNPSQVTSRAVVDAAGPPSPG